MVELRCQCLFTLVLVATGGCAPLDDGGDEDVAELARAAVVEQFEMEGDDTSPFGGELASRCAVDVRGGFEQLPAAPTGKIRYRSMGGSRLPPDNARLDDFGDWDSHIQGFSRLALPWSDNRWAAVTRANPGSTGGAGLFIIGLGGVRGADGTRWVNPGDNFTGDPPSNRRTYLYYPIADTDHPGGIQASGGFIVIAAEGLSGQPPFVNIYQRTPDDVTFSPLQRFTLLGDLGEPVAPTRAITAAALTRLADGRFLLFVLGKDEDQQGWFYVSDQPELTAATSWGFLGHVAVPWLYQNVTLVTECGTRDIYLVGTGNADFAGPAGDGTDYMDLMQVTWDAGAGLVDVPLLSIRAIDNGSGAYCTFRAAATAFVDRNGVLSLHCHAHHSNTNVFGQPDSKLKLVEYAP